MTALTIIIFNVKFYTKQTHIKPNQAAQSLIIDTFNTIYLVKTTNRNSVKNKHLHNKKNL